MWMLQEDSAYAYHVNIFLKWLSSVLHEENVQGDINKCKEGSAQPQLTYTLLIIVVGDPIMSYDG